MGEGYHNFHHQFPMDYRNAYLWYQYDPTKWFIALCKGLGLASNLRVFPSNEIAKGALTMKLKHLKQVQESLVWPPAIENLPIVTWESCESTVQVSQIVVEAFFSPRGVQDPTLNSRIWFHSRRFRIYRSAPWRNDIPDEKFWGGYDCLVFRRHLSAFECRS